MTNYKVLATRQTAALYLAWEFGIPRAHQMLVGDKGPDGVLKTVTTTEDGRIDLTDRMFMARCGQNRVLKKLTNSYANRIREAASFQLGRLGRPLAVDVEIVKV